MQYNYRSRYLVTIDNEQSIVNVYKYEECKFDEAFLVLKNSKFTSLFLGKSCLCYFTEIFLKILLS